MIKGMSWESLLSQEISQTKKEVKQNEAKVFAELATGIAEEENKC
jgi:hypothetical protein